MQCEWQKRSNPLLKIVCSNPNKYGSKQLCFIQKKGLHRFSVSSIDGQVFGQSGESCLFVKRHMEEKSGFLLSKLKK